MKRLLLGLMLLAATAASAEWTRIGSNDESTTYVDKATIRRNGNFVKMWDLKDYKSTQTTGGYYSLSRKDQSEYDCKEEMLRLLAVSLFRGQMGNGEVVSSASDFANKWRPVEPGSADERLWKVACGK